MAFSLGKLIRLRMMYMNWATKKRKIQKQNFLMSYYWRASIETPTHFTLL